MSSIHDYYEDLLEKVKRELMKEHGDDFLNKPTAEVVDTYMVLIEADLLLEIREDTAQGPSLSLVEGAESVSPERQGHFYQGGGNANWPATQATLTVPLQPNNKAKLIGGLSSNANVLRGDIISRLVWGSSSITAPSFVAKGYNIHLSPEDVERKSQELLGIIRPTIANKNSDIRIENSRMRNAIEGLVEARKLAVRQQSEHIRAISDKSSINVIVVQPNPERPNI